MHQRSWRDCDSVGHYALNMVREVEFINVGHTNDNWGISLKLGSNGDEYMLYTTHSNIILYNRTTKTEIWRK